MAATVKDYVDYRVKELFKGFLYILQDLAREHDASFNKLEEELPDSLDIIARADYLTDARMTDLRKRVLDLGNDAIRSLAPVLEVVDAEIVLKVKGHEKQDNIFVPRNN